MKFASFLLALFQVRVQAQVTLTENLLDCIPDGGFLPDLDYFPDKFVPPTINTYGGEFVDDGSGGGDGFQMDIYGNKFEPHNTTDLLTITYHKTYKIVTNKFQNKSYLLYQCGTTPPQDEVDSGRHHLILSVPHRGGLAVTQTTQIPPIELLGLRQELIAYIGDPSYVSSSCVLHMMNNDSTIEQVYDPTDPWNSTRLAELTAAWLQEHPDAIIFGGPHGNKDGDRVVSVAASQERTNVATFDWIAMFAAFYNLESVSGRIAAETQARYDCSSDNAAILSSTAAQDANNTKTRVLWANFLRGYNWSVAECPTWDTTYYCEYAKHCGADMISRPQDVGYNLSFGDSTYWYLNDDELLELGKDADIWIYSGGSTWDAVYEEKKQVMDQFKAVQDKQVYDTQGQGPNSWFEQRLAEYDVVALDFCDIVGTANPNGPPHVRRWLRNRYTEPIGSFAACNVPDEITQPYVPVGAECTPLLKDSPETTTTTTTPTTTTTSGVMAMRGLAAVVTLCATLLAI